MPLTCRVCVVVENSVKNLCSFVHHTVHTYQDSDLQRLHNKLHVLSISIQPSLLVLSSPSSFGSGSALTTQLFARFGELCF